MFPRKQEFTHCYWLLSRIDKCPPSPINVFKKYSALNFVIEMLSAPKCHTPQLICKLTHFRLHNCWVANKRKPFQITRSAGGRKLARFYTANI